MLAGCWKRLQAPYIFCFQRDTDSFTKVLDGLRGIGGMNVPVSLYISSSYIDLFFIPTLPGEFVNTFEPPHRELERDGHEETDATTEAASAT